MELIHMDFRDTKLVLFKTTDGTTLMCADTIAQLKIVKEISF